MNSYYLATYLIGDKCEVGNNLNEDMEQDTSVETETIQTDNDFNTYCEEGDHGFSEYSEQENSIAIEVETPQNKTGINVANDEETESTSESSCQTGTCNNKDS